jgi:hypothetical protein
MNNNPSWTNAIREGRFQDAEAELANIAARQVREQQAANEIQRLGEQSEYGRYTAVPAAISVAELYRQGRIMSEAQAVEAYRVALDKENAEFKTKMKPGYERSKYEGLVSDTEVQDYVASRRMAQAELKAEGARIAGVHNNTPQGR